MADSVLLDILRFLKELKVDSHPYFQDGTHYELGSVSTDEPTVAIMPLEGTKIVSRFACGGFTASQDFAIYYRANISGSSDNSSAIELLENLGTLLSKGTLVPKLTSPRTLETIEQTSTTTKAAEAGNLCDYIIQFHLVYTDE